MCSVFQHGHSWHSCLEHTNRTPQTGIKTPKQDNIPEASFNKKQNSVALYTVRKRQGKDGWSLRLHLCLQGRTPLFSFFILLPHIGSQTDYHFWFSSWLSLRDFFIFLWNNDWAANILDTWQAAWTNLFSKGGGWGGLNLVHHSVAVVSSVQRLQLTSHCCWGA